MITPQGVGGVAAADDVYGLRIGAGRTVEVLGGGRMVDGIGMVMRAPPRVRPLACAP